MFEKIITSDEIKLNDLVEVPEALEGIEYRNMGTQESQIFSKLKKRFCSGRKAFSIHRANALSKICVLSEKLIIEDIEKEIPIDTSTYPFKNVNILTFIGIILITNIFVCVSFHNSTITNIENYIREGATKKYT